MPRILTAKAQAIIKRSDLSAREALREVEEAARSPPTIHAVVYQEAAAKRGRWRSLLYYGGDTVRTGRRPERLG